MCQLKTLQTEVFVNSSLCYHRVILEVILTKYGKNCHQKQQEEYHIQYRGEHLEYLLHHPVDSITFQEGVRMGEGGEEHLYHKINDSRIMQLGSVNQYEAFMGTVAYITHTEE